MSSVKNPVPGILLGSYPERQTEEESFTQKLKHTLLTPYALFGSSSPKLYEPLIKEINALDSQLAAHSDTALRELVFDLRAKLSMQGFTHPLKIEALALVKQSCQRVLGVVPYDTQLLAACIILDGKLAEMATGEGKTLAAAIGVAAIALSGTPVHLITSNDYLVVRDAEKSQALYAFLGLSVGTVTQDMDENKRRLAYACDITYCTAKELVFDYLRDIAIGGRKRSNLHSRISQLSGPTYQPVLRGLCMAVIDEADSILIDEARVPLILSESIVDTKQLDYYHKARALAATMALTTDYILDRHAMTVALTDAGRQKLEQGAKSLGALWHNRMHREEAICQALAAQYLYRRDKHYLVRDDAVYIIDEITGRISPGRVWSRGLHQLIEIKEGCKPSGEMLTAAQITYQRFFPRYLKLSGMSGTLSESRAELYAVFGLMLTKVPLRQPSKRIVLPTHIYHDRESQWGAVVERARTCHQQRRPVLIGTDSVADSEVLSQRLHAAGLAHVVLNARQDQHEAAIVARAGELEQITVSTNMAGRGTDIPLGAGAEQLGGLHLISCQHNTSRRIDRQLLGRCARQGNPGSAQTLISFDKPLLTRLYPTWLKGFARPDGFCRPQWLVKLIVLLPQWLEEAHQRAQRREMKELDARLEREALTYTD
ncbi:MAG TPA: DEAD/DEAH box helicase [Methylophilaceae bacterium]